MRRMEEGERRGLAKKRVRYRNEANRHRLELTLIQRRVVLEQRRGKEDNKRERTTLHSLLHRFNQIHHIREVIEVVMRDHNRQQLRKHTTASLRSQELAETARRVAPAVEQNSAKSEFALSN